jgi:hypothetical protein
MGKRYNRRPALAGLCTMHKPRKSLICLAISDFVFAALRGRST